MLQVNTVNQLLTWVRHIAHRGKIQTKKSQWNIYLGDFGINGRTIFNMDLKKRVVKIHTTQNREQEHTFVIMEFLGSTMEFLNQMNNHLVL
jgi:hypothetical protein